MIAEITLSIFFILLGVLSPIIAVGEVIFLIWKAIRHNKKPLLCTVCELLDYPLTVVICLSSFIYAGILSARHGFDTGEPFWLKNLENLLHWFDRFSFYEQIYRSRVEI